MSSYSEGQTHQLMNQLERAGFTPAEITKLGQMQYEDLRALRGVVSGTHEIRRVSDIINLSIPARLPFGTSVLETHQGMGRVKIERRGDDLYLDGKQIVLYRSKEQEEDQKISLRFILGHNLRKELDLRGNNVSAVVLDYLADHPEFWPESWKKDKQGNTLRVYFWGDIFRNLLTGELYVRCGYWENGKVELSSMPLDRAWRAIHPSAALAS